MKPKQLTFIWQDMNGFGQINTLQWQTTRRTIEEAFDDAIQFLRKRWEDKHPDWEEDERTPPDPSLIQTFKGLPELLDDTKPLRAPTKEEIQVLANS